MPLGGYRDAEKYLPTRWSQTADLRITAALHYSTPLYQLSYHGFYVRKEF